MLLSAVVPCFNESPNIVPLRRRLEALPLRSRGGLEIVLVDDGSTDDTWERLSAWAAGAAGLKAVKLRGNQGVQRAILSGIGAASGEAIGVLDADLQDPPELLGEMLELLRSAGSEAVIGLKTRRLDGSRALSWLKGTAVRLLPFEPGEGDFCVMRRALALELLARGGDEMPFRVRRRRALGERRVSYLPYARQARLGGASKFGLLSLAGLWWRMFRDAYRGRAFESAPPFKPRVERVVGRGRGRSPSVPDAHREMLWRPGRGGA